MQTLAERHADRFKRKAENLALSKDYNEQTGGGLGSIAVLLADVGEKIAGLTEAQRDELHAATRGTDGFASAADAYGDAFDGTGNLKTAGIGVVNPLIAPVTAANTVESESDGAGAGGSGGWGDDAATKGSDLPEGTNADGAAIPPATPETAAEPSLTGNGAEGGTKPATKAKAPVTAS